MKTILFVCTGNTCRSSMAEHMMRRLLEEIEDKTKNIQILSAGTAAFAGQKASVQAIQVMQERNIALQDHQATLLTEALIHKADWILTMTRNHKEQVLRMVPEARNKTYTLKEFGERFGDGEDILDPFGQPPWVYRECAKEIEAALKEVLHKVMEE